MSLKSEEMRRQEILRFCNVPRTVDDVAKEFDVHKQTARRSLWAMRDDGRLKELASTRPKLWQASDHRAQDGEVLVSTSSGVYGLGDFSFGPGPFSTVDMIAGCLDYLWRRSHYTVLNQDNVGNVAKQGSLDPYLHVRPLMEQVYRKSLAVTEVIEFILKGMPELWKDPHLASQVLGPVDLEKQLEIEAAAEWFEEWANARLSSEER